MSWHPHPLYEQDWPEGEYRFFQLGFVVPDLEAAAERWARVFGVGPFTVLPAMDVACTYRGEESGVTMQVGAAQAGPVQVELIRQHCDRPSVFRDVFAAHEGGFHQICTVTPDYDGKKAHLESLGYELACEITDPQRVAYVDTFADFGFYTEIVDADPGFLTVLGKASAKAATWDGDRPVRVLGG
jgi:hypothetical protein